MLRHVKKIYGSAVFYFPPQPHFFLNSTGKGGDVDKTDEGIFRRLVEEENGDRCLARQTALIFMAAVKYSCYK